MEVTKHQGHSPQTVHDPTKRGTGQPDNPYRIERSASPSSLPDLKEGDYVRIGDASGKYGDDVITSIKRTKKKFYTAADTNDPQSPLDVEVPYETISIKTRNNWAQEFSYKFGGIDSAIAEYKARKDTIDFDYLDTLNAPLAGKRKSKLREKVEKACKKKRETLQSATR